jgi:inner membrane transporter RhtA
MTDSRAPDGNFWSRAGGGALMATTSMLCVQLGLAFSVQLFDQLGPLGTAALRAVCAGALFLALVRPRPAYFTRAAMVNCVLLGVVTSGMMVLFLSAVAWIPLGTASALEFLGPLGIAIAGERGRRRWWAVIAAAGVVLLTQPWRGDVAVPGIAFALGAALCWAGYILLTQRVGDESTGLRGLSISMPVAGVVATLVAIPAGFGDVTWSVIFIGLGLAVLHPAISFALEFLALRGMTTAAFGTLMSLEPGIALAIGVIVLGQIPGPGPAAGVALVVIASVGVTRAGGRDVIPAAPPPRKETVS